MKYAYTDMMVLRTPHYPECYIHRALTDPDFFRSVISSEDFKRAIFFVSPSLSAEHEKYLAGKLPEKERPRIEGTLLKYLARMSTRCTPFATLASCSAVKVGERNGIVLAQNTRACLRPDMLYLCSLSQWLQANRAMRLKLKYKANSTLYRIGGKLRYVAYRYTPNGRTYTIEQVSATGLLGFVLKQCREYIGFAELVDRIKSVYEISDEDTDNYINLLIDNQLIISELDPFVTGGDYFSHLRQVTLRCNDEAGKIAAIDTINAALQRASQAECVKQLSQCYDDIAGALAEFGIKSNKKFLVQTDSIRETHKGCVSRELTEQLSSCMAFLNKITPQYENGNLADFKRRFTERYEAREVGLLEALAPDTGIGYTVKEDRVPNTLLAGLRLPQRARPLGQITLTPLTVILLRKLAEMNPAEDGIVTLTDDDVKGLKENTRDLPLSMAAFFRIIGRNEDDTYELADLHFSGASAANMLSRFAHADASIEAMVKAVARQEQLSQPDAVIAEIAHVSESRTGNILSRPHLREYEITYLTNSILPDDHVIPVSDLTVSVQGQKIVLRSRRLQKEVVPRLTTAHNFRNNTTPVYRFLCDLQTQHVRASLGFTWGGLENVYDRLPRVVYKHCILSPAKWVLTKEDFPVKKLPADMTKVHQWREVKKLPCETNLVMGDNKLYINLENEACVALLAHEVSRTGRFVLEEYIPCRNFVTDEQGRSYNNEFILPYVKMP